MRSQFKILSAGPALTLQDQGRRGYQAFGLSRSGAADRTALHEGAALLGQSAELAAIEMVGMGGTFTTTQDTVIALTGAAMTATLDGAPIVWNASHAMAAGAQLSIGGAQSGSYGYLHVAGGFDIEPIIGARASHVSMGIGELLSAGSELPIGTAPGAIRSGMLIQPDDRFRAGTIRVLPSAQSDEFPEDARRRFTETEFRRDPRGNRQGIRMDHDGDGFFARDGLSIVSEVIVAGDIQVTGDGAPYVLMCESQTTGGYPRIATVLPCDLPRIAQAPVGAPIRFEFISFEEAVIIETRAREALKNIRHRMEPLIRDPHDISDLLSYQLISGAVSAEADPFEN